jgi:hypothetical protein
MVNNLRSAFKELVDESVWMDLETQVNWHYNNLDVHIAV